MPRQIRINVNYSVLFGHFFGFSRGDIGEKRFCRDVEAAYTAQFYSVGGRRRSRAPSPGKVAPAFLRRDVSHFFRLPLSASLDGSVERQVVRRVLPDHLSSLASAVGSGSLPHLRSR